MSSQKEFIPFNRPEIGEEEVQEVVKVLRSGWLTTGECTKRFEADLCQYTGARYGQAVNSCTAGLHLALAAMDIGPGDEVITTPLTFCATVNVILHQGATPVLADIGDDFNISPESIRERITGKTRAIIPVHFAGLPCRMTEIWEMAGRKNIAVIEDAAHAIGTHYLGHHIGGADSLSDAVAYSFYATKNLTTGEGGMVTTNREDLFQRMKRLTLHGISKDAYNRYTENGSWYYEVVEPGFKYNLSDLQSAVGVAQLKKLEGMTARRAELATLYDRLFEGHGDLIATPPNAGFGRHCWHLYVMRINPAALAISRDAFISELKAEGIGTSVHFIPVPKHPFFAPWAGRPENQCPRAMSLYDQIISLPLYPGMTEDQVRRVAASVLGIAERHRKQEVFAGASAPAALQRQPQQQPEGGQPCTN